MAVLHALRIQEGRSVNLFRGILIARQPALHMTSIHSQTCLCCCTDPLPRDTYDLQYNCSLFHILGLRILQEEIQFLLLQETIAQFSGRVNSCTGIKIQNYWVSEICSHSSVFQGSRPLFPLFPHYLPSKHSLKFKHPHGFHCCFEAERCGIILRLTDFVNSQVMGTGLSNFPNINIVSAKEQNHHN